MKTLSGKAIRRFAHRTEQLTGWEYRLLPWGNQFLNHPWIKQADVIHLHNLHGGFFPIKLLPKLARIAPLVWSIHDLWPTTGHCYFPQMTGCECWTGACPCIDPQQDDWYPLQSRYQSRSLWLDKRDLIAASSPTFIAQSSFTEYWLREAPITRAAPITRIPYALDTQTFHPSGQSAVSEGTRRARSSGPVVMFSAVSLSQRRKGGAEVVKAASLAADRLPGGLTLLTAGSAEPPSGLNENVRVVPLGHIDNDKNLALAYSSADLFIGASIVETFGQVFSEAASCGTPGVAFDTSGVSDAIRSGETGLLAPMGNVETLADYIVNLLTDDGRREQMARRGRAVCEAEFAYPVVAEQLIALYESRCQSTPRRHG